MLNVVCFLAELSASWGPVRTSVHFGGGRIESLRT